MYKKWGKALKLLSADPGYPSLQTHEIEPLSRRYGMKVWQSYLENIDFVGGATYAINGSLQAVSNNIFIAAPDSIEVSGDLKSEIMNENTISPQLK